MFMDLRLSSQHETLRDCVRDFLAEHGHRSAPTIPGERPGAELLAWQKLLLEHGYAGRTVPREYGGYGAEPDVMEQHLITEEFTRAGVALGIGNQGISMLVPTLLELGTEEQKREYIAADAARRDGLVPGLSEPGAGSDLAALQTRGVEDGEDFVINGQKIWTSTAHEADMIFCLVRTEPDAPKHAGISYLLFSMKSPGIDDPPAEDHDRARRVQRGVLHRRARAQAPDRRPARRWLEGRQRDAEARTRLSGQPEPADGNGTAN
jgi:alkylation response protein AidB-like acyl-CoA dehydrogenase